MTLYRTIIKRDGLNPLTGKAQYRVDLSYKIKAIGMKLLFVSTDDGIKYLFVVTPKRYQPNTFINPRRAIGV